MTWFRQCVVGRSWSDEMQFVTLKHYWMFWKKKIFSDLFMACWPWIVGSLTTFFGISVWFSIALFWRSPTGHGFNAWMTHYKCDLLWPLNIKSRWTSQIFSNFCFIIFFFFVNAVTLHLDVINVMKAFVSWPLGGASQTPGWTLRKGYEILTLVSKLGCVLADGLCNRRSAPLAGG